MGDYLSCHTGLMPIASATSTSNIKRQDRIRERELFRFYRPDGYAVDNDIQSPPSSPPHLFESGEAPPISNNDVTLGALAQLVALRLGVHRCMINVIGRETQYTLVESTKTLDLVGQTTAEVVGDEAWLGSGGSIHKSMSLCENVVALPSNILQHPFLIIPDLSEDERFKDRPYVAGFPHYRFYAGTPLKTARGVVIGALCVFAHQPRNLSETEQSYMATISETIMQHLEMKRAAAERDKVTRMSRGLSAFIEGKNSQFADSFGRKAVRDALSRPITPMKSLPSASGKQPELALAKDMPPPPLPSTAKPSGRPVKHDPAPQESSSEDKEGAEEKAEPSKTALEEQFSATITRAASLLDEALGLKEGGGVVFYDTVSRVDPTGSEASTPSTPFEDYDMEDWSSFSDGAITPAVHDSVKDLEEVRAPILSSCVSPPYAQGHPDESYRNLTSRLISKFLKWYPAGRTWEFDEQGIIPGQDEGVAGIDPASQQRGAEKEARKWTESHRLMSVFPGVRSLIFLPLWDANLSRHYAACFAWTTDAMTRFSADVEFSFITAFGNSISAEISRLATIDADQRKSDFIGSVSHELRSPLHGVLASAEFLADTKLDSFQSTLVGTIDSCGRTLLDTINHVLDFSKINSLRRTWKKTARGQKGHSSQGSRDHKAAQSSGIMSILGSTDIAAITEEVVDSVYAGKIYAKAFSPADITDVDASGLHRRDSEQPKWTEAAGSDVQVLLDIAPGDYHFVTQPGAIRRIIMNIFGNALKYTDKGSILVRLWQQSDSGSDGANKVILVVKDTGKGISQGYIRTRLFTPFAQENDLAPGTGLGLSIVRNIVTMLRGDINLKSKVGCGTEVKIVLPNLMRPTRNHDTTDKEQPRSTLFDFNFLREREHFTIGLYGFASAHNNFPPELDRILRRYLEDWCEVAHVVELKEGVRAKAVVVDETNLESLENSGLVGPEDNVVVLCKNPTPVQVPKGACSWHYFLLKPFGPYKLAKTLRKCIERSRSLSGRPISMPSLNGMGVEAPEFGTKPTVAKGDTRHGDVASKKSFSEVQTSPSPSGLHPPKKPRLSSILAGGPSDGSTMSDRMHASESAITESAVPDAAEISAPISIAKSSSTPDSTQEGRDAVHNPRILVVDDNKTNRMLLQTFLKKRGLPSDSAEDGGMAVQQATSKKYDIIFMDISMPVMNGFEATREIRRHEESTRKQIKRESMGFLRSRPSSGIWQHGAAAAMTPSPSQQQHPNRHDTPSRMNTSDESNTEQRDGTTQMIPSKPVTPPISPEDEESTEGKAGSADTNAAANSPKSLKPALIIALTGLASGRDQAEAFSSGVDLYMTKPVSFKEVRRLLDSWSANGGLVTADT